MLKWGEASLGSAVKCVKNILPLREKFSSLFNEFYGHCYNVQQFLTTTTTITETVVELEIWKKSILSWWRLLILLFHRGNSGRCQATQLTYFADKRRCSGNYNQMIMDFDMSFSHTGKKRKTSFTTKEKKNRNDMKRCVVILFSDVQEMNLRNVHIPPFNWADVSTKIPNFTSMK